MAISPWGEEVPSPKIVINLSRTHETYIIKDNHIGSLVSEIFHNRQVERHTIKKLMFCVPRYFIFDYYMKIKSPKQPLVQID